MKKQSAAFSFHDAVMRVNDRRGYTLQPGFQNKRVTINEHGFRGQMPEGDKVIVCLGDSVPFGAGVKDHETYPHHMGALNAACPSYNIRQSIDRLHTDVLHRYDWDRIACITLQAANDASLLCQFGSSWTPDTTWADSYLPKPATKQSTAYMLGNLRIVLEDLVDSCENYEVPLVLLPIDPNHKDPEYRNQLDVWDESIKGINALLCKTSNQSPWVHFFPVAGRKHLDIIHYTPRAARKVAKGLREFIDGILEDR